MTNIKKRAIREAVNDSQKEVCHMVKRVLWDEITKEHFFEFLNDIVCSTQRRLESQIKTEIEKTDLHETNLGIGA